MYISNSNMPNYLVKWYRTQISRHLVKFIWRSEVDEEKMITMTAEWRRKRGKSSSCVNAEYFRRKRIFHCVGELWMILTSVGLIVPKTWTMLPSLKRCTFLVCVCARDSSNHKISFQWRRKEKPQHSMNGDCVRKHIEIEVVLLWNQQPIPSWTPTNCFSKRMQTISFYNDKHNTYTKRGGIRRFSVIKKQAMESTLNRFACTKNEPLQRELSKTILLLFVMSSHNQSVAGAE